MDKHIITLYYPITRQIVAGATYALHPESVLQVHSIASVEVFSDNVRVTVMGEVL